MNKQAYDLMRGAIEATCTLTKTASTPMKEDPIASTSSLISSTPSALVRDAVSSPINLSSAVSASSGSGVGHDIWKARKNHMGTGLGLLGMAFPNTVDLYHAFLDPNTLGKTYDSMGRAWENRVDRIFGDK